VVGSGADGAAAIALADQLEPDVVVMDGQMPGVDGADAHPGDPATASSWPEIDTIPP
jgi:chemotaxis response regulator CheB